jgi:tRNA threonylcarbamoyladenosine biosynthesis protein TsaB
MQVFSAFPFLIKIIPIFGIQMLLIPNILAIETSGPICSLAISGRDERIIVHQELGEKIHGERITGILQIVLKDAGIVPNDLVAVAVSGGPGSFTGLRVGLSTAKGLCLALGIPLMLLPTLECLGAEALRRSNASQALSLIQAREGEWYSALWSENAFGETKARTLEELRELQLQLDSKTVLTGPSCEAIDLDKRIFQERESLPLSAEWVLKRASHYFERKQFADLATSEPIYVKPVRITPNKGLSQPS